MRYISTSDEVVERLKKQARKLQRNGAGKHTDLLNRVAKQAGYDHWHHVIKCNAKDSAVAQIRAIRKACEDVIAFELHGESKVVVTTDGIACPPFVLFSTGIGDAWLLEPNEHLAICLVWQGQRQPIGLRDDPDRIEVEWDGRYVLLGDFFSVESRHPVIGTRALGGYGSYLGEISPAPENLIHRDFQADSPNEKWLTDITEFQIPAGKIYLLPMIDCFDGPVVSWTLGTRPDSDLVNTMLDAAIERVSDSESKPIIHSDRGANSQDMPGKPFCAITTWSVA